MPNYTPNEYAEQITDIKQIFDSLEKDYISLTSDDDKEVYTIEYSHQQDELITLQSKLMSDMDNIRRAAEREEASIVEYNTKNKDLNSRYTDIKDKIHGAIGMKNDTQTLYNQEYYGNILIFCSILGGCLLYARTRNL